MTIIGVGFSEINEFLTEDVAIQNQLNTPDGGGGDLTTWPTETVVKGLVAQASGSEVEFYSKKNVIINSKIYLKKGSIVSNNNRLVINGKYYDNIEIRDPVSADEFIIVFGRSNGKV